MLTTISNLVILYLDITQYDISVGKQDMNVYERYIPMTETAFYILLSLKEPLHGYGIIQNVADITKGRILLGAGTVYGTLSKLLKDGVIDIVGTTERRKIYRQSSLGTRLLEQEINRISEQLKHAERSGYNDKI